MRPDKGKTDGNVEKRFFSSFFFYSFGNNTLKKLHSTRNMSLKKLTGNYSNKDYFKAGVANLQHAYYRWHKKPSENGM